MGWIFGKNKIFRTTNNGEYWTHIYTGSSDRFFISTQFVNRYIGYLVARYYQHPYESIVMKTTDGGYTWRDIQILPSAYLNTLYFLSEEIGMVFGNLCYKTNDNGSTWNLKNDTLSIHSIFFSKDSVLWLASSDAEGIYKSHDFGETYEFVHNASTLSKFRSIYFTDLLNGYTVGWNLGSGFLSKTTDGGSNWLRDALNFGSRDPYKIIFNGTNQGYITFNKHDYSCNNFCYYRTRDGGLTWSTQDAYPGEGRGIVLSTLTESTVIISGHQGYPSKTFFLKTTDGGTNWYEIGPDTAGYIWSGSFADSMNGWFINRPDINNVPNFLYRTTNQGLTWLINEDNIFEGLWDICFIDNNRGWAVGDSGKIVYSSDGGESWYHQFTGITNHLRQVQFINEQVGYSAGGGYLLKTTNSGLVWDTVYYDQSMVFDKLQFINEDIGWVLNQYSSYNTILKTTDGGRSWIGLGHYNQTHDIYFISSTVGYRCGRYVSSFIGDGILKTTDGGITWNEQFSFHESSPLFLFGFYNTEIGWCVGPKVILKTTNGGVSNIGEEKFEYSLPISHLLKQNYPNPFNPSTKIKYEVSEISFIIIKVYDVLGNEIGTLVREEKPAGTYEVEFDGTSLPSGVYLYQLRAGNYSETKKMVLLR
jgi:photosystem II stability/assembly factor-like uncharacterized protein